MHVAETTWGTTMLVSEIITRVQDALAQSGTDCSKEELLGLCPELTWNQVFLAIDYLSQTGQVQIMCDPDERYRVPLYHVAHAVTEVNASQA